MIEFLMGVSATLVVEYGIASVTTWYKSKKEALKTAVPTLETLLQENGVTNTLKEKADQVVDRVEAEVKEVLSEVKEKAEDAVEDVKEGIAYGSQYVKDTIEDLKEKFIAGNDAPTSNNSSKEPPAV